MRDTKQQLWLKLSQNNERTDNFIRWALVTSTSAAATSTSAVSASSSWPAASTHAYWWPHFLLMAVFERKVKVYVGG